MAESKDATRPDASGFTLWYLEHLTEHSSNQLTIYDAGVGVHVGYSIDDMPLRALGGYHIPVDIKTDAAVAALRADVERLSLRTSGHSTPPTFGIRTKVLRASVNNRKLEYLLDADAPLPAELEPIEKQIHALMARAVRFPLATLAMTFTVLPTPIHVGDVLKISVEFSNAGKFPVHLVSPASFRAGTANSFRLNFWHRTGDAEDPYEFDWTLDLIGKELLVEEHKTLASKGPAPAIDPGAKISAWTTVRLPRCKPHEYLVELVYITNSPGEPVEGDRRVFGELHAGGVPLVVVKRGK